jgi:glycosyltransferase involved in cell wall biosynthesis
MSTTHNPRSTKHKTTLSVVLATKNEEENIARCLNSVKRIADEIIVFDESSTDKTREIAKSLGAKVYKVKHESIFHITKQKAIDKAKGEWILQLDADEAVTPELAKEIKKVVNSTNDELKKRIISHPEFISGSWLTQSTVNGQRSTKKQKLLLRHQMLIERRDGSIGKSTGEAVAFFLPRVNIFMGKPLIHGGVYPDGVIRLIKQGKARLPGKSVHEQMQIDGEVAWLVNPLEHYDSPTFSRYINRNNRYTNLFAKDYQKQKLPKNVFNFILYMIYKPLYTFSNLYFRHKAILDGYRGFIWSFFSALRFPISYIKYLKLSKK